MPLAEAPWAADEEEPHPCRIGVWTARYPASANFERQKAEIEKERHREVSAQLRDAFRRLANDGDLDAYDIVYRTLCGWAGNGKARDAGAVSEFAERLTKAIMTRN